MPASLRSDYSINISWQGGQFRPVYPATFAGLRRSLALRRQKPQENPYTKLLYDLIDSGQNIYLTGFILQEILQGISQPEQFNSLKKFFDVYPLIEIARQDYVDAAKLYSVCRKKGVQASTIDFLIATIAINHRCHLLTSDHDFINLAKHCSLKLIQATS